MIKALLPAAILGALAVSAPAEAGDWGRFHRHHHHRHDVLISTGIYGVTPYDDVSPFYVGYRPGFYPHRRFHHHRRFYR